jgi:transposase
MTTKKVAASYSLNVRERAVRLVLEGGGDHPTQWAAITSVSAKIGCAAETLRKWVRQAAQDPRLENASRNS